MVLATTVFRWPLWLLLALSRTAVQWHCLFVVYPGDKGDIEKYAPRNLTWLRTTWLFRGKPQFAGIQIRHGSKVFRGIVVYVSSTVAELRRDRDLALAIVRRLRAISSLLRIRAIALAGQLPSVLQKHEIALTHPFVTGRLGSAFSVVESLNQVCEKHGLKPSDTAVVVVGVGFLGQSVVDALCDKGYSVEAIDIVKTRSGIRIGKDALRALNHAGVVVVLTPRGEDFLPYLPHLGRDSIILDDTHPRIRQGVKDHVCYKVALQWPGFKSLPRLPGYRPQWIPGCMVEAIVSSQCEHPHVLNHADIAEGARSAGIKTSLNR